MTRCCHPRRGATPPLTASARASPCRWQSRSTARWPAGRELGIAVTAYGVLSRGLIGGRWSADTHAAGDTRLHGPRFQSGNVEANVGLVDALRALAAVRGVTVAQLAIAWVAAQGEDIVPVLGARRRDQLVEALGGMALTLSDEDLAAIEAAVPRGAAAGERYHPALMAGLDSETA